MSVQKQPLAMLRRWHRRQPGRARIPNRSRQAFPLREPTPASMEGADPGTDRGGRLRPSLEGSGATTNVSDARTMVATAARGDHRAGIEGGARHRIRRDRLSARAAGRRDPPDRPAAPVDSPRARVAPRNRPGWTMAPATGTQRAHRRHQARERRAEARQAAARPRPLKLQHISSRRIRHSGYQSVPKRASRPAEREPWACCRPGFGRPDPYPDRPYSRAMRLRGTCFSQAPVTSSKPWLRSALLASSLEQPG